MARRWLAVLVLTLAALGPTPTRAREQQVDFAAVTLTPADIGAPGWVHDGAFVEHIGGEAANAAGYLGRGTTPDSVAAKLAQFGWRQMYVDNLSLPGKIAGAQSVQKIRSYVTEYATADGAASGFAYLEDESSIPSAKDIPTTRTFGDQSELTSDRGTSASDGRTYRSLDLTFRIGNLVAGVTHIVYPSSVAIDPDQKLVETLAALMESRISSGATKGAGLGLKALRLNPPNQTVLTYEDAYYRLDGVNVPLLDESETAARARIDAYAGATDVYQLWQGIDAGDANGLLYGVTLLHFPSEAAARKWVTDLGVILAKNPYYGGLQPVSLTATLGDQSTALSYIAGGGTGKPRAMIVAVRVGADVARVHLVPQGQTFDVSPIPAFDLAKTQEHCLAERDCPELTVLPDSVSAAPAATPVVSPIA